MDQYLDHLQVERMVSPNTLDGYRRDLTALASWADANGHDLLLSLIHTPSPRD